MKTRKPSAKRRKTVTKSSATRAARKRVPTRVKRTGLIENHNETLRSEMETGNAETKTQTMRARRPRPRSAAAVAASVALGAVVLVTSSPAFAGLYGNHNETLLHDES